MARYDDKTVDIPDMKGIYRRKATAPGKSHTVFYSNGVQDVLIGYACPDDDTRMAPNDNYIELFKDEWARQHGRAQIKPMQLRFGMYAATSAILESSGLRGIMDSAFGTAKAGKLLDYAMYSILFQSDATSQFESRMNDQVLFSGKAYSDSAYSSLFEKQVSNSDILDFKKRWAGRCKELGHSKVWLCIDGSNEDCKCKGVELAEKGHSKSKKNVNIISFTYAVTGEGFPVTFSLYRGGLVDAKAMQEILDFLGECGISAEGVILDRGYCTKKAIEYLGEKKIDYVIMIKGEPDGWKEALDLHKGDIKDNARQLVKKTHLYAAQEEVRLFSSYDKKDYVTVFYDFLNGAERLNGYLGKLYAEIDRLEGLMAAGKEAVPDPKYKDALAVDRKGKTVELVPSVIQKHIDETGLYGIVHSKKMTPYEVHQRYASRNASEKQYCFVKTMLGYGTGCHLHLTQGTKAKYCLGFISSIIRHCMEQGAGSLGMAATSYFRELNLMSMTRVNKMFYYTHTEKKRQMEMIALLGKDSAYLDEIVADVNKRMRGYVPPLKKKKPGPKPKAGGSARPEKRSAEKEAPRRRKPGPKPGYKHTDTNRDGSARRKPGPKPGSKKGLYNNDGSLRKKPGPKPGSHHGAAATT